MLGSLGNIADTFKGIIDGFAETGSGAFDKIFDLATGSLGGDNQ